MAPRQSLVHAQGIRVWFGGGNGTLVGAGKGKLSVLNLRDLVMTLEIVMRTQVPVLRVAPKVLNRGVTFIVVNMSSTYELSHKSIILESLAS